MANCAAVNMEWIKSWARAFQFIGAILLVLLAIMRFVTLSIVNPPAFILTLYYFVFAALLIVAEFQIKFIMKYFHFLYYGWGKSVLDFFLFTIWFDTSVNAFFPSSGFIIFLGGSWNVHRNYICLQAKTEWWQK